MSARAIARWMIVGGVAVLAFYWYPDNWFGHAFIAALYDALAASLLAISLTVLLIDGANEQRDRKQLKKRLIWEMGSSDQAFANRAVKELRDDGWLDDGSLKNANLTLANLQRAQLSNAYLEGAILSGANLGWAHLDGANLRGSDLTEVAAERLNARKADFEGAILRGAKLPNANLDEIETGERLDLLGASLIRASLRGAKLRSAQLEECDFFGADLTGIDLAGAALLRANMTGAILDGANLERADLSELGGWTKIKSIEGAKISGVRNAPAGFRNWAAQHGAIDSSPTRDPVPLPESPPEEPSRRAVEPEPNDSADEESDSSMDEESDSSNAEQVPSPELVAERLEAARIMQPGDSVNHSSYGLGIVTAMLGTRDDPEAQIDFGDEYGVKHLVLRYAPIQKP